MLSGGLASRYPPVGPRLELSSPTRVSCCRTFERWVSEARSVAATCAVDIGLSLSAMMAMVCRPSAVASDMRIKSATWIASIKELWNDNTRKQSSCNLRFAPGNRDRKKCWNPGAFQERESSERVVVSATRPDPGEMFRWFGLDRRWVGSVDCTTLPSRAVRQPRRCWCRFATTECGCVERRGMSDRPRWRSALVWGRCCVLDWGVARSGPKWLHRRVSEGYRPEVLQ